MTDLAALNTLTLVGDVDQLLYRFAGAKPELMTEEVDSFIPDISTYFLSTNYRSTQTIVKACSHLIRKNYIDEGGPYPQEFMKETGWRDDAHEGAPITFQMYPDVRAEAQSVADTILEQMELEGYEFGDFYVSSRTRAQLAYLEGSLFRAGIKFVNLAGGSFWDSYHIRNIVAYLELAYDTTDQLAFEAVYNIASGEHTGRKGNYCHHRWLGREFLRLTNCQYGNMHLAIRHNRRYTDGVQDLQWFVQQVQGVMSGSDTAAESLNYILEYCYRPWLQAKGELIQDGDDGGSSLDDDIATALDIASQYSVEEFLVYVNEMREAAAKAKDGNLDDYTVIATIHRLKGSERKVMIGIGWCEGTRRVGLQEMPVGLLPITWAMVPPPQFGVLPTSGMGRIEDERCVAFVCVSRAKEKVFLTAPARYRDAIMHPSRFIDELGEYIQIMNPVEEKTDDNNS